MSAIEISRRRKRYLTAVCGVLAVIGAQAARCQQASPLLPYLFLPAPAMQTAPGKPQATLPWSVANPLRASAAESRHVSKPSAPGTEGLTVHGHWVIDVKNPDGSIAIHRDFENSLVDQGNALVGMLAGYFVPGDFAISLIPAAGASICATSSCAIVQSTSTLAGASICATSTCSTGLMNVTSVADATVTLSGQFLATQTGSVGTLFTQLGLCGSRTAVDTATTPAACVTQTYVGGSTNSIENFTGTSITAIPVSSGQTVSVTVTLSFS